MSVMGVLRDKTKQAAILYSTVGIVLTLQFVTVPTHVPQFLFFLLVTLVGVATLPVPSASPVPPISLVVTLLGIGTLNSGELILIVAAGTLLHGILNPAARDPIAFFSPLGVAMLGTAVGILAFDTTSNLPDSIIFPARAIAVSLAILANNCLGDTCLNSSRSFLSVFQERYRVAIPVYAATAYCSVFIRAGAERMGIFHGLVALPLLLLAGRCYKWWCEESCKKGQAERATAELRDRSLYMLTSALSTREQSTRVHQLRMRVYCKAIGTEMELSPPEMEDLLLASRLHNIGSIVIPDHVLLKPGPLTFEEREQVRTHPAVGAEMLASMDISEGVLAIVRAHHEKWDGTGYPANIAGENIPIGARILAAVDSLDALLSERSYRGAMPMRKALEILFKQKGSAYDPDVVTILARRHAELEEAVRLEAGEGSTTPRMLPIGKEDADPIIGARRQNQMLQELSGRLAHALDVDGVGQAIHKCLSPHIAYDTIAIYSHRAGRIEPVFVYGPNSRLFSKTAASTRSGLSGFAIQQNATILNGDTAYESFYRNDSKVLVRLQSALAVPVFGHDGGNVGVVTLYHAGRGAFTTFDQGIIESARSIVGSALENAVRIRDAESMASTDHLTGIPNARALSVNLKHNLLEAAETQSQLCVFVCDLDGFKQVNDRFGHLKGNEVLQFVAVGLREACRPEDFVARMGGDEFVVVVPGLTSETWESYADRLRNIVIDAGWKVCGEQCLGMSLGASFYPADGADVASLIDAADDRMYKQKQEGKRSKLRLINAS